MSLFSYEFMQLPKFDFVIFAGVLYHVQDQIDALKRVRAVAGGTVLLETIFDETLGSSLPYARFFEGGECNGDPTNWWAPNFACLEGMIRTAGFSFERSHTQGADSRMPTGQVSYMLS